MSAGDPNNQPSGPPGSVATPPTRSITADEYDALQARYDALQRDTAGQAQLLARLQPFADDIEWLVEGPGAADAVRRTRQALAAMKDADAPQYTAAEKALLEKVSHLDEFVTGLQKREQDELERPQREQTEKYERWKADAANVRFFDKLVIDHPEIQGPHIRFLAEMAAADNFASLETTWNKVGWMLGGQPPAQPPPSSLRADAGEAGATPPAGGQPDAKGPTMRDRIIQLERARRGISA